MRVVTYIILSLLTSIPLAPIYGKPIRDMCILFRPIDLGRPLNVDSVNVTVPFKPGILTEGIQDNFKFRLNDFCVGEHTDTHLDAPFHFNEKGWKVADIPLERLLANGVFLNVSEEAAGNSSFRLQRSHIDDWIALNGPFPPNAVLLISYGWAQFYSNRTAYLGTTSLQHKDHIFPGMSADAAKRLAEIDDLVGVGVDTASLDPPMKGEAHTILSRKNIYFLEHVDLDKPCLPATDFMVFSMPINIEQGTGAPSRIIAIPPLFCSTLRP